MRAIWLATAALAALTVASAAQTVERKNSAVFAHASPIVASSWSGFYLGFGLGFRATRTEGTVTSELMGPPLVPFNLSGLATGQSFNDTGFRATPYVGFNWQFAPRWISGIEGDAGFGRQTRTRVSFAVPLLLGRGDIGGNNTFAVKATWDASLRGRVGFLLTPSTLAYATGGVAWQQYGETSTCVCNGSIEATPKIVSGSKTKAGWTVGGGLETALWGHWLARAEYRYADFGNSSLTVARSGRDNLTGLTFTSLDNVDVWLRTHTATFGLAYKFADPVVGDGVAAFAYDPASVVSWSGIYAGLGLGARVSQSETTTTSAIFGGTPFSLAGAVTDRSFIGTAFRGSPYGLNWQIMPRWVVGIEGDAGLANQTTTQPGFFTPFFAFLSARGDAVSLKTTWDASLRGRIGLLLSPATLAYLTSGVAWQHFDIMTTCASPNCAVNGIAPAFVSVSTTRSGWTLGGGIETALWGSWLARAEYRYADFGSTQLTIARTAGSGSAIDNFDFRLRTHLVNFGLAYKFN